MSVDADFQKRRITRLLQVREQSKEIAKKIRCRVNEEREKQLNALIASKQKDFDLSKQKSLKHLRHQENMNLLFMGEGHSNVVIEDEMAKEWKNQRAYNARISQQRSAKAFNILKKKKLEDEAIQDLTSRRILSRTANKKNSATIKNADKNRNFQQNYLEAEDCINQCNNLNTKKINKLIADKIVEDLENSEPISTRTNNSNKSPYKNKKQLDNIQNKICNCNDELNIKNDDKARCIESNKHDSVKLISPDKSLIDPESSCVLNIASQFIKNRKTTNQNEKKDINTNSNSTIETIALRDVIQRSRNLNSELIDHFHPPIPNLPQKLQNHISDEMINIPMSRKQNEKTIKFKHHSDAVPIRKHEKTTGNIKEKFNSSKSPSMKSKPIRWKPSKCTKSSKYNIGSPDSRIGSRKIKCYDHPNRFMSNISVDDDKIVKKLNKSETNAFQSALLETEENNAQEKFVSETKKRQDKNIQDRGEKAIEQIRIESDYKKLLDELDILVAAERQKAKMMHITDSAFQISQSKENAENQHLTQEKFPGKALDNLEFLGKIKRANIKSKSLHGDKYKWISDSLNVADLYGCSNNYPKSDPIEASKENSDSSHSIIISNNSCRINNVNFGQQQIDREKYKAFRKNSPRFNRNLRKKNYLLIHENSSEYEEYSNTTEDISESRIKVTQKSKSSKISDKNLEGNTKKTTYQKINLARNISSSTQSSISFQGFQITIDIKKNKKESSQNIKPEQIKISENPTAPSNGTSLTSTATSVNKSIVIHQNNSVYNFDSSESTAYMSPPEKITTRFNNYNKKIDNIRNPVDSLESINLDNVKQSIRTDALSNDDNKKIVTKEKCVGTSIVYTNQSDLILENKGIQVDQKNDIDSDKSKNKIDINPQLRKYVLRLLEMSKNDIDKLSVDVSDVSTPSSSIINMSSNVKSEKSDNFKEKIKKLKCFIAENYSILDELNMELIVPDDDKKADDKNPIYKPAILSRNTIDGGTSSKTSPKKSKNSSSIMISNHTSVSTQSIEICDSDNCKSDNGNGNSEGKPSPISDKSEILIDNQSVDFNNKNTRQLFSENNNSLTSKDFHKLLSQSLNLLKKQTVRSSSTSNSSEEFIINSPNQNINPQTKTSEIDVGFIPMLSNIPRPDSTLNLKIPQILHPIESNEYNIPQNVSSGSNFKKLFTRDADNVPMTPHELSTILEVDTPITIKNMSDYSKNIEILSPVNLSSEKANNMIDPTKDSAVEMPRFEDSNFIPADVSSFMSYREHMLREGKITKNHSLTETKRSDMSLSNVDSTLDSNPDRNYSHLKSQLSISDLSKRKILEMSDDQTLFHTIMQDNSSSSSMTDFETWLKNNGMSWGISTLKKSQESLSSTSTSTKSDHVRTTQTKLKTDNPKLNAESEENTVSGELTTSSEDVLAKTIELQTLFEKLNKLNSDIEKKKTQQNKSLKFPTLDNSSINLDTLLIEKNTEPILTDGNVTTEHSKDKTQHRTSTPVQNIKFSISSNPTSSSQSNSNGLFSIGSDISSVKNLSNSDRNTSDDQNTLIIPNISLKFNKLFDSNTSNQ